MEASLSLLLPKTLTSPQWARTCRRQTVEALSYRGAQWEEFLSEIKSQFFAHAISLLIQNYCFLNVSQMYFRIMQGCFKLKFRNSISEIISPHCCGGYMSRSKQCSVFCRQKPPAIMLGGVHSKLWYSMCVRVQNNLIRWNFSSPWTNVWNFLRLMINGKHGQGTHSTKSGCW